MKRFIIGNWLRGYFEGEFESIEVAWSYLSKKFLMSFPAEKGRHVGLWVEEENRYGFKSINLCKEDVTELNAIPKDMVNERCKCSMVSNL